MTFIRWIAVLTLFTSISVWIAAEGKEDIASGERTCSVWLELLSPPDLVENGFIGDDWKREVLLPGKVVPALPGTLLIEVFSDGEVLRFGARAVEDDPTYDDVGVAWHEEQLCRPMVRVLELRVEVHEGHGPAAGGTSTWLFRFRLIVSELPPLEA